MNSRKEKRLESKKKKAAAFLELVRDKQSKDQQVNQIVSENIKRQKMDENCQASNQVDTNSTGTALTIPTDTDNVLLEMKKIIRERKKAARDKPKVFLTLEEMIPYRTLGCPVQADCIPPLYVMDLQQLLLFGAQGNMCTVKPRWCKLQRAGKVSSLVVILIEGIGNTDYTDNEDCFPCLTSSFSCSVEMVSPLQYSRTVVEDLYHVPLSVAQLKKPNVKVPARIIEQVAEKLYRSIQTKGKEHNENVMEKMCLSRKCLLLSTQQMIQESYPLPVVTGSHNYQGFVFSKDEYAEVTEESPLLALDCEMCQTMAYKNELTRVSIVTEKGELIYDSLVKPYREINNYLTKWSGITKELLDPVETRLEDVQREIQKILPADAILCGQSLNCDLNALKMFHPYVIDTSIIFNMSGNKTVKAGLRKLSHFFLDRKIQGNREGHCSHEDAQAALDLVKLKLSKGLEFGDATLTGIYYPDIKTYFLGVEKTDKKSENIEADLKTIQNISRKKPAVCDPDSSDTDTDSVIEEIAPENRGNGGPVAKKMRLHETVESQSQLNSPHDNFTPAEFEMEQKKFLFSQNNSVHINHSLFKLLEEAGRPGCVIDREEATRRLSQEPVDVISVSGDSSARKSAKQVLKSKTKEFVLVRYQDMIEIGDQRPLSESEIKEQMRKTDERIQSVMKCVRSDALAAVVLTGSGKKGGHQNMRTFLTIT